MIRAGVAVFVACLIGPAAAAAQAPAEDDTSRVWLVAGAGSTTRRAHCRNCEEPGPYTHSGSILVNGGIRINERMDGGGEVVWLRGESTAGDRNRITMLLAVAQFRPWTTQGFFLKGGMGMGFVRNWIYTGGSDTVPPYTSKALSLVYGGGWVFRHDKRIGLQIYGTHHAVALGDLQTSTLNAENIMGNIWSAGAAIVIR